MDKKDGGPIDLESLRGFTPGPWRVGTEHGAEQLRPSIRILRDVTYAEGARPTTYVIGDVTYPTTAGNTVGAEERRANARLIAAAPDMYAVLRELAECSQYWSEYDVPLGIHDRIVAALAKARGQ